MRAVALLFLLQAASAVQDKLQDSVVQASTNTLTSEIGSKLDRIASELEQSQSRVDRPCSESLLLEEKVNHVLEELGSVKAKLEMFKDAAREDVKRVQSEIDVTDNFHIQEIDKLNAAFVVMREEISYLKKAASEAEGQIGQLKQKTDFQLANASAVQAKFSDFVLSLNETRDTVTEIQLGLSQSGLDQCLSGEIQALCKGTEQTLEAACPTGWLNYPGSSKCVRGFTDNLDYPAAIAYCKTQGKNGNLVSVHSEDQHEFLKSDVIPEIVTSTCMWIGFNDIESEGQFEWSDGSPVDITLWKDSGLPITGAGRGSTHDCVYLCEAYDYLWVNRICTYEKPFICQIEK